MNTFATLHPLIQFIFFISALVFGMVLTHPAFAAVSLLCAAALLLTARGAGAWRFLAGLLPVFLILTILNPVFNTLGGTVLFTYFGRPYTLEALRYGGVIAAMFCGMMIWFAVYNHTMTSDKFLYLFGALAPSVSLILTMVLRLVPNYRRQAGKIESARRCIGKGVRGGDRREAVASGGAVLSALTSWALEGGVITADSMRSRGFGTGRRSAWSSYRFSGLDRGVAALMVILAAVVIAAAARGGASAVFTPVYEAAAPDRPWHVAGLGAYAAFLLIPTIWNIVEEIRWHILRSAI